MKTFCIWVWITLVSASSLFADDVEIQSTISNQLEAFRQDDFGKAFSYASPTIQGVFGTSERFEQMVRTGFPMVHRNADVKFLNLQQAEGTLRQHVQILDIRGVYFVLEYIMIQIDEEWRIDGVRILRADEVSA